MSQILVVGNDPKLRERLGRAPRRRPGAGVRVEFLELTDVARLARKRPQAIVLDVRSPSAATIEVISRLRRRLHQPPLMLQVTPRQMQERVSWTQALPTSRIAFFTSQTSKKEIQGLLERLLEQTPPRPAASSVSPAPPQEGWHEQNDRRIDLIFKERDHGLIAPEKVELQQLQTELERRVDRRHTLGFEALAEWEQAAQRGRSVGSGRRDL